MGRPFQPLMIFGPGGVGKSTLVARFILEHAQALERDRFPFAYLDFDRPDVDAAEPLTLLIEALRQLCVEYPGIVERAEEIRADWARLLAQPTLPLRARTAAVADFARLLYSLGAGNRPVLFVLDTFEEVQWRSSEYVNQIFAVLTDLHRQLPALRIVVAGRAQVTGIAVEPLELTGLDSESAEAFLAAHGVHELVVAARIAAQVGGDPQNLKLAARDWVATRQEGESALPAFFADLEDGLIRAKLHGRVLNHIHDPNVRQLAHPGLVLRRLTPDLILSVLAVPCELKISTLTEAEAVFAQLRREVALVKVDADGALIHLPELRKSILELLEADARTKSAEIHAAAVAYYKRRPANPVERAEEVYHRLKLDQPREICLERWLPGMENRLLNAVDEFGDARHAFLAARLGLTVSDRIRLLAAQPDWEMLIAPRVRTLLANGEVRPAQALLNERAARLADSVLIELEVEALVRLDRQSDARDLLTVHADAASTAGRPDLVYRRLLLLAALMVATRQWAWATGLVTLLQLLNGPTGGDRAPRLALAAAAHAAEQARPEPELSHSDLAAAFDAATDNDLLGERDLLALAGSQLRSREHLGRLRRLIELVGLPREDDSALQALAARIAEFDRDSQGGSLASRLTLSIASSGTQTWSQALQQPTKAGMPPALSQLLEVYGPELPDPVIAALADLFAATLTPQRWLRTARAPAAPPRSLDSSSPRPTKPRLPGQTLIEIRDHLLAAFPDRSAVNELLLRMDISLASLEVTGSTFRETVLYVVNTLAEQDQLAQLIATARAVIPGDPGLIRAAELLGVATLSSSADPIEKLIQEGSGLDPAQWRQRLGRIEGQVCRIEWTSGLSAFGTGFLIGQDRVLTAAQVVGTGETPLLVRFDYIERDGEAVNPGTEFRVIEVQRFADRDFALLRLDGAPGIAPVTAAASAADAGPRGWIELADLADDPPVGAALAMAHHRNGGPLQLAVAPAAVVAYDRSADLIFHSLVRQPGSAGAPIFDAGLRPVALQLGWVKEAPGTVEGAGFGVLLTSVRRALTGEGRGDLAYAALA